MPGRGIASQLEILLALNADALASCDRVGLVLLLWRHARPLQMVTHIGVRNL